MEAKEKITEEPVAKRFIETWFQRSMDPKNPEAARDRIAFAKFFLGDNSRP